MLYSGTYKEHFWIIRLMGHSLKYCMLPTVWAQKLNKLDDIKKFNFKKGNRDLMETSIMIKKSLETSKDQNRWEIEPKYYMLLY